MTRLGTDLARLLAKAETPLRLGIMAPGASLSRTFDRLQRYRLAWYSARKGRMVLRSNITQALLAHVDRRAGDERAAHPEPTWCDCCGVPYPCTTRRLLTRPPMDADL